MHLWATPKYTKQMMSLAIEADAYFTPPADREYLLELIHVPDDVIGAPPVGTVWELPLDRLFVVTVPTYRSMDGLDAYQFTFKMTEIPEPAGLIGLVIGGLTLQSALRRRSA